jgi:hypothetical protein
MWVRMSDEWKPTGVWDALLIELLLGLSMPPEAVMAMSAQERIETLQQAAADGRLSPDQTARLTLAGLLPADDEPVSGE